MIFHSFDFIIFIAIVFTIYWTLGRKLQNIFLVGASYYFYGYVHPWFLYLILTSTLVDFICGIYMERYRQWKKYFLLLSLTANLGMLCIFKYYGFFVENIIFILDAAGLPTFTNTLHIVLPVGISFYTFQTMGYSIDVYRDQITPRHNFLDFALYVSFFPQLVAGPIERASRLLPQIESDRSFSIQLFCDAILLILHGFFLKLVVADNVAVTVNKVFAMEEPAFFLLWTGVFGFSIQVFADFSAYTNIARGTAKLLGFELMENFVHPYIAHSPAEFWKRWHISLTGWIRDYVFTPPIPYTATSIPQGKGRYRHGLDDYLFSYRLMAWCRVEFYCLWSVSWVTIYCFLLVRKDRSGKSAEK